MRRPPPKVSSRSRSRSSYPSRLTPAGANPDKPIGASVANGQGGKRMTTTVEQVQEETYDHTVYEIDGTPSLNGRNADAVFLTFETYALDRTDVDHMELAGRLDAGEEVRFMVVATAPKSAWATSPK